MQSLLRGAARQGVILLGVTLIKSPEIIWCNRRCNYYTNSFPKNKMGKCNPRSSNGFLKKRQDISGTPAGIAQGRPFPENFGGFWCLVSAVEFLVDFFRPFPLGKQAGKNPPKNPPKNPRFSRKLFDQNSLKENSALRNSSICPVGCPRNFSGQREATVSRIFHKFMLVLTWLNTVKVFVDELTCAFRSHQAVRWMF